MESTSRLEVVKHGRAALKEGGDHNTADQSIQQSRRFLKASGSVMNESEPVQAGREGGRERVRNGRPRAGQAEEEKEKEERVEGEVDGGGGGRMKRQRERGKKGGRERRREKTNRNKSGRAAGV
jgi:hypothetical protein